ncbi:hypothetical protein BU17DRAFT_72275 [Hysterangium stoloniferum]|nr:hypothetical protein BU17DRAFT_72275 [Hysterangium stoloniferum]
MAHNTRGTQWHKLVAITWSSFTGASLGDVVIYNSRSTLPDSIGMFSRVAARMAFTYYSRIKKFLFCIIIIVLEEYTLFLSTCHTKVKLKYMRTYTHKKTFYQHFVTAYTESFKTILKEIIVDNDVDFCEAQNITFCMHF